MSLYKSWNFLLMKKKHDRKVLEYFYDYTHLNLSVLGDLGECFIQLGGVSIKYLLEIFNERGMGLTGDIRIDWELDDQIVYIYNTYWDESISFDSEEEYKNRKNILTVYNSVQLSKDNFLDLFQQWIEDVSAKEPDLVLLWQDKQGIVYLETFESEDLVRNRVDEVKRVVGEMEVKV